MISTIISVMNRTDRLGTILPSWANFDIIKEIIITDWSSKENLIENQQIKDLIKEYPKIKIIRIDNQEYFHLPKSYNLAFNFTNPEYPFVLKIDADYLNINESNWLDNLLPIIKDDKYINGINLSKDKSLSGFLLIHKKNFGKGYKENLANAYGADDIDLYNRIEKNISKLLILDLNKYIYHIPHTDKLRVDNYQIKELNINKLLNNQIKEKNIDWDIQKYKILENSKNYVKVNLV